MRSTIRRLALVPGTVLAAGALILGTATAAGATVTTGTTGWAGYRAGNGNWNFRYIQGLFTIPQNACATTGAQDDFNTAGVHLGGSVDFVTLGVNCTGGTSATSTPPGPIAGVYCVDNGAAPTACTFTPTTVTADDTVFASIYYNQANNLANLYEFDETSSTVLVNTWVTAGTALYKYASAFGKIIYAQPHPPTSVSSYTLVPFSQVRVTSYNGTAGAGIDGPWGVQDEEAFSGAHEVAGGTSLSNGWTTFNVTEYGNA